MHSQKLMAMLLSIAYPWSRPSALACDCRQHKALLRGLPQVTARFSSRLTRDTVRHDCKVAGIPEVDLQAVGLESLVAVLAGDFVGFNIAPMLALNDAVRCQHHISLCQLSWVCCPLIAMKHHHLHNHPSNYSKAKQT